MSVATRHGDRHAATSLVARQGIAVAVLFVLAACLSMIVDSSPAHARAADVSQAPGCPGADPDFPLIDLCQDNGFYELASTGSLTGGANITMSTTAPPCNTQDAVTDIFEPDGCYSEIEFEIDPFNCVGIDVYNPDDPYWGTCGFYEDGRNPGVFSGLQGDGCRYCVRPPLRVRRRPDHPGRHLEQSRTGVVVGVRVHPVRRRVGAVQPVRRAVRACLDGGRQRAENRVPGRYLRVDPETSDTSRWKARSAICPHRPTSIAPLGLRSAATTSPTRAAHNSVWIPFPTNGISRPYVGRR